MNNDDNNQANRTWSRSSQLKAVDSGVEIPSEVMGGLRNPNAAEAIECITKMAGYPCMSAVKELVVLLENEPNGGKIKAAREAIAGIISKTPDYEKRMGMVKMALCSTSNADGIISILAKNGVSITLKSRMEILASAAVGVETKAEIVRGSDAGCAAGLIEHMRMHHQNLPRAFEVMCCLSGEGTKNGSIRAKAMEGLARFGRDEAIPILEIALGGGSERIRAQAVNSLKLLWTDAAENRVEEILSRHMENETNPLLKIDITDWLGENGRHTISKLALWIASWDVDAKVSTAAKKAFENLGARLEARPVGFQSRAPELHSSSAADPKGIAASKPSGKFMSRIPPDLKDFVLRLMGGNERERNEAAEVLVVFAEVTNNGDKLRAIETALRVNGEFAERLRVVKGIMRDKGVLPENGMMKQSRSGAPSAVAARRPSKPIAGK